MLGAEILEEEGLVRLIESEESTKHCLQLRCTLPDYLLSGVENAFYVTAFKNPKKEKSEDGKEEEWWDVASQSDDLGSEGEVIQFIISLKGFPKSVKNGFIKKIKDKKIDFSRPELYYKVKEGSLAYLTDIIFQSKDMGGSSEEIMDRKIASLEKRIITNVAKIKADRSPIENLVGALCGALKRSSEPASNFKIPICLCYRVALGYVIWRGYTPEEFASAPVRESRSFGESFDAKRFEAFSNSMEYAILQNMFESLDFQNYKSLPAKEYAGILGHIGENNPGVPVLYERFAEAYAKLYNMNNQAEAARIIADLKPEAKQPKELLPEWFFENK